MHYLKIHNLSFKYNTAYIFTNLNMTFQRGWTCLVGENGSGKTTLLKLIASMLPIESGSIEGNELVYYCSQELSDEPEGLDTFISTYDTHTFKLKNSLGIKDDWLYRWSSLSFGERKRIQIAVALFLSPDILLLDEPTNHLDMGSKRVIVESLKKFKGIGILVSHDRMVLNTLCTHTTLLKHQQLYSYKTNYHDAMNEFNTHVTYLNKQNENTEHEIKRLKRNMQIQKEKVNQSKKRLSKRDVDKHDSSLKEKINLAKLTGKDKSDSKKVTQLLKKVDELQGHKNQHYKSYNRGVIIKNEQNKKGVLLHIKAGHLQLHESLNLEFPELYIRHGDRIVIIGDNGVGKSSFINHIIKKINPTDNCLYIPQEIDTREVQKIYKEIEDLDNDKKGELYTYIQRLSSNPKKLLQNTFSSPGELRKLFIAKALLDNISTIILDEPTNHMDIDSIESLEEALKEYNGTLLCVSHDRAFIDAIKVKVWHISKLSNTRCLLKE